VGGVKHPSDHADPGAGELDEVDAAYEPWVRCARCVARVAPASSRTTVNGSHVHEFMNPAGIRYTILTFASAPGCAPEGERSTVWTWFPGHAWQVAICRACGSHLGWSFDGPGASTASFHGLIRERIALPAARG
jgi:hypothetical protein